MLPQNTAIKIFPLNIKITNKKFYLQVWEEFSERDFQNVYESAHREEVAEWDRDRLINEIKAMERKHKEMVGLMQRMEPDVYLERLVSKASSVMEKNRLLKMQQQLSLQSLAAAAAAAAAAGSTSPGSGVTSTAAVEEDNVASSSCGGGSFSPPVQA